MVWGRWHPSVGWDLVRPVAYPKGEDVHLANEHHAPRALPELMVVGGGKGGVGKSCFSVNLAVEIARRGWRVVLVARRAERLRPASADYAYALATVLAVGSAQGQGDLDWDAALAAEKSGASR